MAPSSARPGARGGRSQLNKTIARAGERVERLLADLETAAFDGDNQAALQE